MSSPSLSDLQKDLERRAVDETLDISQLACKLAGEEALPVGGAETTFSSNSSMAWECLAIALVGPKHSTLK